jgi:hypothetical protein
MKSRIAGTIGLLLINICSFAQQDYYVAPTGNDRNQGSKEQPFKTIHHALQQVIKAKDQAVRIFLREGIYYLDRTLEITPALLNKKQVQLAAYGAEKVTLSGAAPMQTNWKSYTGKIQQAYIGKGLQLDQLFCNGKLLQQARYPNYDSSARVFHGTDSAALAVSRIRNWKNPAGGYIHALHEGEWGGFHYRINRKIKDSLLLEGGWQNNRPSPMHRDFRFVENIFEELDAPGEWYYNQSTGILYLYPPSGVQLESARLERSVLDELIYLHGSREQPVKKVVISRIQFTGTNRTFMKTREPLLRSDWTIYRGGAVLVEGAEEITIQQCSFSLLGGHAVFVSRYNREVRIENNHIHTIGGNAIAFVGDPGAVRSPAFRYEEAVPLDKMDFTPGPNTDQYPAACNAFGNLIHSIGQVEKQVAGVQISMAMDIRVEHNTIYQVPRAGINIGDGCWGGHTIAYNDVFQTVLETGDHGAFNSWGRDRYWVPGIEDVDERVRVRPDFPFLDMVKPITLNHNRFHCEHGWDIDLDDGSSHYRITNNVCLNGGLKLREGYDRIVKNNILVNTTFHPHVWYANSGDVFTQNIVTSTYAPIRVRNWGLRVDSNYFIQPGALAFAREQKTDTHSLTGNPLFVNDQAGDYRVQSGSDALSIGFQNFSMEEFGVVDPVLRKLAASPPQTGIRLLQAKTTKTQTEWLGARIKNIETLGEQSASGSPDKKGVLIVQVSPGSLAAKSGLQPGDIIRSVNEETITDVDAFLTKIQSVNWQGSASAQVLHKQQLVKRVLVLK